MKLARPRRPVSAFDGRFRSSRDVLGFGVTRGEEGDVSAAFGDREGKDATVAPSRRQKVAEAVGTTDLLPAAPSPAQDRVALVVAADDLDVLADSPSERAAARRLRGRIVVPGVEAVEMERTRAEAPLGRLVEVVVDRPAGSAHPRFGWTYPVNYGYVPGTLSGDGEPLDAYVLGVAGP